MKNLHAINKYKFLPVSDMAVTNSFLNAKVYLGEHPDIKVGDFIYYNEEPAGRITNITFHSTGWAEFEAVVDDEYRSAIR